MNAHSNFQPNQLNCQARQFLVTTARTVVTILASLTFFLGCESADKQNWTSTKNEEDLVIATVDGHTITAADVTRQLQQKAQFRVSRHFSSR